MIRRRADIGKVILASAGPGDPELITLKAVVKLRRAEVVLVDRLVSPELLKEHVNPLAEVVTVGKQWRCKDSTPQERINALMVRYAFEGKYVVRLKGGDVSIFSNVLDELNTLVKHCIPYEIIPGVTAVLGAAAYSGFPLTARGYASGVRFLTLHRTEVIKETCWRDLAQTDDTLVFYMSVQKLEFIVEKLLSHGISKEKSLAVIEQATTPLQRVHLSPLRAYREKIRPKKFRSPSLLIVGEVVTLRKSFQWLPDDRSDRLYFKELLEPIFSSFENLHQSERYVS